MAAHEQPIPVAKDDRRRLCAPELQLPVSVAVPRLVQAPAAVHMVEVLAAGPAVGELIEEGAVDALAEMLEVADDCPPLRVLAASGRMRALAPPAAERIVVTPFGRPDRLPGGHSPRRLTDVEAHSPVLAPRPRRPPA